MSTISTWKIIFKKNPFRKPHTYLGHSMWLVSLNIPYRMPSTSTKRSGIQLERLSFPQFCMHEFSTYKLRFPTIDLLSFYRKFYSNEVLLLLKLIFHSYLHLKKKVTEKLISWLHRFSILIFSISAETTRQRQFFPSSPQNVYSSRCAAWKLCH